MEVWRLIPSMPGYAASSEGRVRSLDRMRSHPGKRPFLVPGRVLRLIPSQAGYLRFTYGGRAVAVHKAVLEAFAGPRPTPRHQAAHGDRDKTNNRPENLRWATPLENSDDKRRHGTMFRSLGELSGNAVLTAENVLDIRGRVASGERQCDVAALYGISRSHLCGIVSGRFWRHIPIHFDGQGSGLGTTHPEKAA